LIKCCPLKKNKLSNNYKRILFKTSSFRFCRRFERSSILRSKRSTRIALAPFNLVAEIFVSAA
jgi:hypothetical protein